MAFNKKTVTMGRPARSNVAVIDGEIAILIDPSRRGNIIEVYMVANSSIKTGFLVKDFTAAEMAKIHDTYNMIATKFKVKVES